MFRKDFIHLQNFKYLFTIIIGILIGRFFFISNLSSSSFPYYSRTFSEKTNETNLILSTALNMPLLNIYRFIRTARSTCNDCYIIIFVNDMNNNDYKELTLLYNVLFLSYDAHKPNEVKGLAVYSLRFIIYYDFLLKQQYKNIFICDLRDTLFQRNIFDEMKLYKNIELYAFLESEQLSIGGCKIHREWILSCYGQETFTSLFNQSRSCAGSTLGTYKGIMKYLSLMNSQIRAKPQCNDQGIHNYLVYYMLNDTSTSRITHENGFLGTLGTTEWVYRNKYGLMLNKNSQVYSVVHQFDHSQQVKRQIDREYQLLSDDILKLKN